MKLENLSKTVDHIYVRRYRVVVTPELIEHHARNRRKTNFGTLLTSILKGRMVVSI